MNFALSISDINPSEKIEGFWNRVSFGGTMLLMGMAVVFSVLIVIWGALTLFKIYFAGAEKKPVAETVAPAPVVQASTTQETEIVAVIAAAIAAAESESDGIKFKVVSFRRK